MAVDSDEVVLWVAVWNPCGKQLFDRGAVLDLDTVGEAGTVVVDEHDLHGENSC
ncbi:MAG: hypothetical protein ACF8TS_05230 [Maioricimonas sp. JB049]